MDAGLEAELQSAADALEQGRIDEGLACAVALVERTPDCADAHFLEGLARLASGDDERASVALEAALERQPERADIMNMVGVARLRTGEIEGAAAVLSAAVAADPDNVDAAYHLGIVCQALGDHDRAVVEFQRVLALEPALSDVRGRLGASLFHCRRAEEARVYLRAALAEAPADLQAKMYLGLLDSIEGRHVEAVSLLREVVEAEPYNQAALLYLAQSLQAVKDPDAVYVWKQLLALRPGDASAWIGLGLAFEGIGERRSAQGCYRRAVEFDPDGAEPHTRLGNSELREGRLDAALRCYATALARAPGDPEATAGRAMVLTRRRAFDEAEQLIRPHLGADPVHPLVVHAWASLCRRIDRPDLALLTLRRLLDRPLGRDDEIVALHDLGDVLDALGEYDEAFAQYQRANALRGLVFDVNAHQRHLTEILAVQRDASLAVEPSDSDLPVFVVGMPRSGTTLVERIIDAHPDAVGLGELGFIQEISVCLAEPGRARCPRPFRGSDYLAQLRQLAGPDAVRVVDKQPFNFTWLGLIGRMLPRARVIHCVRDPIDVLWSCYRQRFGPTVPFATDLESLARYYISYRRAMDHWAEHLELPMLEVRYEDLVRDIGRFSRRNIDFLGLQWDEACLAYHQTGRVSATTVGEVQKPVYGSSVGRSEPYRAQLQPMIDLLERANVLSS